MAGNDTAALVVALSAKLDKFEKDMSKAGDTADKTVSGIERRFAESNPSFGPGFLKALIPAAAVAGAIAAIKQVVDALAELGDKAEDYRIGAPQLQALSQGAQIARVSSEQLNKALTTFTDVSKKADDGTQDFYAALKNIGGGFTEAFKNAPTQEARLQILAQAMASTTDEVKRAQLGLAAFGSDSERVTNFIATLSGGLDGLIQRSKDLGIAIDDAMVKEAQTAQTQLGTLSQVISNELLVAMASLIPTIVTLLPYLEKIGAAIRDSIASFVSADSRPTATLEAEIKDSTSAVAGFQKQIEELQATSGKGLFGGLFGDSSKQIAEIQTKIDKEKEFQALRLKILDTRSDAEDDKETTSTGGAFKPRSKLVKDPTEDTDAFERAINQSKKAVAVTEAETATIGLNSEARERARTVAILEEAAKRANTAAGLDGTKVSEEQRVAIDAQADAALRAAQKNREAATQFQAVNESLRFFGNTTADILGGVLNKTQTVQQGLTKALQSITNSFLNAALTGEGAFAKILGLANPSGGVGGLFGALFGGFKADGGPITAGTPYVVGERGPEIIVPKSNGTVIPNSAISKSSGGGGIAVYQTIAPVFNPGMTPTDMASIRAQLAISSRETQAATISAIRQGQRASSTFLG